MHEDLTAPTHVALASETPEHAEARRLHRIFGGPDATEMAKARLCRHGGNLMERMRHAAEVGDSEGVRQAGYDLAAMLAVFQGHGVAPAIEHFAAQASPMHERRTAALYEDMAGRFHSFVTDPQFLGDPKARSMFAVLQDDL